MVARSSGKTSQQLEDSAHSSDSNVAGAQSMEALSRFENAQTEPDENTKTIVKAIAALMRERGYDPNQMDDWKASFGVYAGAELTMTKTECRAMVDALSNGKHIPWTWRKFPEKVVDGIMKTFASGSDSFHWDKLAPNLTGWMGKL